MKRRVQWAEMYNLLKQNIFPITKNAHNSNKNQLLPSVATAHKSFPLACADQQQPVVKKLFPPLAHSEL